MKSTSPEYCGFRSTGICQWMPWSACDGTVESAVCCALPPCIDHAARAHGAASSVAAASRSAGRPKPAVVREREVMRGNRTTRSAPPRVTNAAAARGRLRYPRAFRATTPAPEPPEPMPAPTTALRTVRFGHSPDADDAYMFYGFHTGEAAIDGCRVEHVLQDIQSLNARALRDADLEITACSAHAYAHLADRYAVMACGASFGWGYGPVLVARGPCKPESLAGKRV